MQSTILPLLICAILALNLLNLPSRTAALSKAIPSLRVLTFNIWNSGKHIENGLKKIVKHIKLINPDVVALQEVETEEHLVNITKLLGPDWTSYFHHGDYIDTAIVSRHEIFKDTVAQSEVAIGGIINIPIKRIGFGESSINISFWSIHTKSTSYGPYAACNKLVSDESQIMAGEMELGRNWPGRVQNTLDLLANPSFRQAVKASSVEPLILAGDFNSPSHLDWTEDLKDDHCNWSFEWPTTKLVMNQAGLTDSFRELYPDPKLVPGITWSTVVKFSCHGWGWTVPEPQDRIDMILYRGKRLKPIYSQPYQGNEIVHRMPHAFKNDYPSDHLAVITDFAIVNVGYANAANNDDDKEY